MTVETRAGFPVFSQRFGQGAEPAMLLHCGMTHSGVWSRVAEPLGDRLTMTAFDLPGHGQSGDWDHRKPFHDQATEIAQTFLTDGMHLIGHSAGATIALRLALENPGMVRSLVLIEPVLFAAARAVAPDALEDHAQHAAPMEQALTEGRYADAAPLFFVTWGGGAQWDDLPPPRQADFVKRVPTVVGTKDHFYHDVAGLMGERRLEALDCPVLLIRGSASPAIIAAVHDGLEARLPNATQQVVDGAQHLLPLTHAKLVSGLISDHLNAVSLARADTGLFA
ncbi:alpha/beta fold hydrolase [Pseudoprimorskyibacter insulae]|uniref:Dihydrolipoyllysine-residue acetyltransferase component of acetoin cleaving system n=1 Tax=Pseudoprimorskyibacter insulae TaxID=1695997 RepID=A0A2R8ANF0_9RHOB|nr:alpha/beta hydrolase [Pseudoprimorskyibacter insulae]SPF77555.1 Dihydrolipoyllysine-residue acetyltransferase component of acetoin cleaving system [Pseudoprimorskyibacter insulae]